MIVVGEVKKGIRFMCDDRVKSEPEARESE
jgi:hypothetical protein